MTRKQVVMFWHGGSNYAVFDCRNEAEADVCSSLAAAKRLFAARAANSDGRTPCVESPQAWLFIGRSPSEIAAANDQYPDAILALGPRGGVRLRPA